MILSRRSLILAGAAAAPSAALASDRLPPISIRRSEVTVSRAMMVARPDLPVPSDPDMLFYVQQSIDRNTLVYAARRRGDGTLDPRQPVEVFWRRFNEDGAKRALSFFERVFAFGVSAAPLPGARYDIRLAAFRDIGLTVEIDQQGRPRALGQSGGRTMRIVYAYAEAEKRGFLPTVRHVDVHGFDVDTGEALRERVRVTM